MSQFLRLSEIFPTHISIYGTVRDLVRFLFF